MPSQNNSLISIDLVSMQYDRRPILRDINLSVNAGDFLAITGPNGGGKTTLLRILLRLLHPTRGSVTYRFPADRLRLPIGYLPQKNLIDSHFPITVKEVVSLGMMALKGLSRNERDHRLDETIDLLGLQEISRNTIGEISGGQLQRTLFGRAIISRPLMLVLDEPLSYLDKHYEKVLYEIIDRLAADTTILLVSHEMSTISSMANRHLIIDHTLTECHSSHHFSRMACDDQ